jgi:hypothetical protein
VLIDFQDALGGLGLIVVGCITMTRYVVAKLHRRNAKQAPRNPR